MVFVRIFMVFVLYLYDHYQASIFLSVDPQSPYLVTFSQRVRDLAMYYGKQMSVVHASSLSEASQADSDSVDRDTMLVSAAAGGGGGKKVSNPLHTLNIL